MNTLGVALLTLALLCAGSFERVVAGTLEQLSGDQGVTRKSTVTDTVRFSSPDENVPQSAVVVNRSVNGTATVIPTGWRFQKQENDMPMINLGFTITDQVYDASTGILTWNLRMVVFNDYDTEDAFYFIYSYDVISFDDGYVYMDTMPTFPSVNAVGPYTTVDNASVSTGYGTGMIFPTGFIFQVTSDVGGNSRVRAISFELSNFSYNSQSGQCNWNVHTNFEDAFGSPDGYQFKYSYAIVLSRQGSAYMQSSGVQTATGSGATTPTMSKAPAHTVVVAPVGWNIEYPMYEHHEIASIGVSATIIHDRGSSFDWRNTVTMHEAGPDNFQWEILAGILTFPGQRIDGSFNDDLSLAQYRFDVYRDQEYNIDYISGPTSPGTYVPFTGNVNTGELGWGGGFYNDRLYRLVTEDCPSTNLPDLYNPSAVTVKSTIVYSNAEGSVGGDYAKWVLWGFAATSRVEYSTFLSEITEGGGKQFDRDLCRFVPSANTIIPTSVIYTGPFLSERNKPEWGEEDKIGPMALQYSGFPIWNWSTQDRLIIFLWEGDECFGPFALATIR